jgi:hypothetical protein
MHFGVDFGKDLYLPDSLVKRVTDKGRTSIQGLLLKERGRSIKQKTGLAKHFVLSKLFSI